jgi:hypothetical protein
MTTLQRFPASLKDLFDRCAYNPATWCWEWTGPFHRGGYGRVPAGRRGASLQAHRLAYEYTNGPIPEGLQIDHLCRVRCCINPDHLEAVTPSINVQRSLAPAAASKRMKEMRARQIAIPRTHCPRGHELTAENVIIERQQRDGSPVRKCRVCRRMSWARSRQKETT